MIRAKVVFCSVALMLMWTVAAQAGTLYLSVAASMTDVFQEIIALFSETYPDTKVLPNFASSGSLAKQIAQGAPADFYVSANTKWMQYLLENDVIIDSTCRVFAFNSLVFVGDPDTDISELTGITSLQKIGIGTPQSVPVGQYARQALEAAGVYQSLVDTRKLVFAKDTRQALLYADRGAVDGSFVYKTDALLARHAKVLFTVPTALYDRVSYPLALTVGGGAKDEATAFYEFMAADTVQAILVKHGFEPAD